MSNGFRSFADLVFVLLLTALAVGVVAIDGEFGPLRVLLGLLLVLFAPGYVLVATLYPEASTSSTRETGSGRALTGIERGALSVLLSICIVPLLGLVVDFATPAVTRESVLGLVAGWIGLFTMTATVARLRLPPSNRFSIDFAALIATRSLLRQQPASLRRSSPFTPQSRHQLLLNGFVALGVLLLVASVGFAAVADPGSESFTELYLLSENEDGELVAEEFDTTYDSGETLPLTVAVGNHEGETVEYSGVVLLQRTTADGTTVESQGELERFGTTVADGETELIDLEAVPSMAGEELRLRVLLYAGDVPDDPSADTAYRSVHLDVTVEE